MCSIKLFQITNLFMKDALIHCPFPNLDFHIAHFVSKYSSLK